MTLAEAPSQFWPSSRCCCRPACPYRPPSRFHAAAPTQQPRLRVAPTQRRSSRDAVDIRLKRRRQPCR